jgi:hypothetical protein
MAVNVRVPVSCGMYLVRFGDRILVPSLFCVRSLRMEQMTILACWSFG